MNKRKIARNYFLNLSYQMLSFIIPLVTTPYISRVLTEYEIGQYSYTHSIIMYFILCGTLGLNLYGQREIAYKQNDVNGQRKIFSELVALRGITITIAIIVYLVFMRRFPKYRAIMLIQMLDIVAAGLDISWLFQGREEFDKTVRIQMGVKIAGTVMIFALVHQPADLVLYVGCLSVPVLMGNLLMWLYVPKTFSKSVSSKIYIWRHLKPALLLFVPQIAMEVYTVLDRTMIGGITHSDNQVGYYEQAQKIVKTSLVVVTSLSTVMLPRIASTLKNQGEKSIVHMVEKSFRLSFFLSVPIMFGLMSVSVPLVTCFMGERYIYSAELITIISPVVLFIGIASVTGNQILLPMNMQKQYTLSVVCGAGINLIINLVLIPKYGTIGACVATVMAEFVVMSIQLLCVKRCFDLRHIIGCSRNYWISGIIMAVVLFFVGKIKISAIFMTIVQILTGCLIYSIMLVMLKDELILKCLKILNVKREKNERV